MKFLKEKCKIFDKKDSNKQAFTIIELLVSIVVTSIIFFIVFYFINNAIKQFEESNYKTRLVTQLFEFRDQLNKFIKWWYIEMSEVWTGEFETLMLKDVYWTKWLLFWVVNQDNMKLQEDYLYDKNVLWYRLLSQTEITSIESDNSEIYNLNFYNDKIYDYLKIKDFQLEFYNSWTILDLNVSVLYKFQTLDFWKSFTWVYLDNDDYIEFNLNY